MKVVINRCYGGFGLSDAAYEWLIEHKGWTLGDSSNPEDWSKFNIVRWEGIENYAVGNMDNDCNDFRTHPDVIEVIETLGKAASSKFASLKIVEVPDDVEWFISDYDGIETIHEKHKSWC